MRIAVLLASLLLAFATLFLWIRSYWVYETLTHDSHYITVDGVRVQPDAVPDFSDPEDDDPPQPPHPARTFWWRRLTIHSEAGRIWLEGFVLTSEIPAGASGRFETLLEDLYDMSQEPRYMSRTPDGTTRYIEYGSGICGWLGIDWDAGGNGLYSPWRLHFPYWLVFVLMLPYPAWRLCRRWQHGRRIKAGHCACCGYDLRATPVRCPECGTATEPNARSVPRTGA